MPRLALSSDKLPPGLDEAARLDRWMEMSERFYGSIERVHDRDSPFFARLNLLRAGAVMATRHCSTLVRASRTSRNVGADGNDGFLIGLYADGGALAHRQLGRSVAGNGGGLSVLSFGESGDLLIEPGREWMHLNIPGAPLRDLVATPDDLVATPIDPASPAVRFLRGYLGFLFGPDAALDGDPVIEAHVAANLVDLVALCLGAGRDAAHLAGLRGLRRARLELALAGIRERFADPGFTVGALAARLGVSARYVQALLHETGTTFSERVLELRLQRARSFLVDPRMASLRISDIALACGFNEVSHFNRCFRRRFGLTPTAARSG